MRMKASEVSDWLRQIVGKRDRREVVPDDNDLVLRLVGHLPWGVPFVMAAPAR